MDEVEERRNAYTTTLGWQSTVDAAFLPTITVKKGCFFSFFEPYSLAFTGRTAQEDTYYTISFILELHFDLPLVLKALIN